MPPVNLRDSLVTVASLNGSWQDATAHFISAEGWDMKKLRIHLFLAAMAVGLVAVALAAAAPLMAP